MFVLGNRPRPALLAAAWLACLVCSLPSRSARADSDGKDIGFGPLLVFTAHDSIYLGWELAATNDILSKNSLGGAYRISQRASEPSFFHYVAWEPWVYVGGTLGRAVTHQ